MSEDSINELLVRKSEAYAEYQNVCRTIAAVKIKSTIEKFKDVIPNESKKVALGFSWEWNDEDGTDPYINHVSLYDGNGEIIDLEGRKVTRKSEYSGQEYESDLEDYIRDEISNSFNLHELLEAFDERYEIVIELN